jgi:hypothetical protein
LAFTDHRNENDGNETTASLIDAAPYHSARAGSQGIGTQAPWISINGDAGPGATATTSDLRGSNGSACSARRLTGVNAFQAHRFKGCSRARARLHSEILNRRSQTGRLPRLEAAERRQSRAERFDAVYLRDAQAYMLISMPTDTSTIFGVFQVIRDPPN